MNHLHGFTLVELMVSLAILAIISAIAVPNFNNFIQHTQMTSWTNDLISDLVLARSEAAKRGSAVSVCASANGTSCGGSWADGRIVFSDSGGPNRNVGDGTLNGNDTLIRSSKKTGTSTTVTASGFTNSGFVSFGPTGSASIASNVTPGTFKICDNNPGNHGRQISISAMGRTA